MNPSNSNKFFMFLYGVVVLVAIWLFSMFSIKMTSYIRASNPVDGKALYWGVLSKDEDHHYVFVDYTFHLDEKTYRSQHVFKRPCYKNREAAQYAKEALERERVTVWYERAAKGKKPFSLVDRTLPVNEGLRSLIAIGILIYFYFLRRYVAYFGQGERESGQVLNKRT